MTLTNKTTVSEHNFDTIVHQFSLPLYLYARKNMRNNIDAEDIVQECFVRLWEKFENISDIGSIKSYLYAMVRNECINRLKSKRVVEYRENYDPNFSVNEIEEFDAIELVIAAIETLPPQYSKIMMHSVKGMRNNEIACELNIAENSVKVMKARSLKKLKSILGKETFSLLTTIMSI